MRSTLRTIGTMLVIATCVLGANSAFATPTPLLPGTTVTPSTDTFAGDIPGSYSVLYKYMDSVTNGDGVSVTLYADVVSTGGHLDILYQLTDNAGSSDSIAGFTAADYSSVPGVAVAGFTDTTAPSGTNFATPTGSPPDQPTSAYRTAGVGSSVTFSFTSPLSVGSNSAIILVQTSDTAYDLYGGASAASSTSGNGAVVFSGVPEVVSGASVPEPSSLVMASLALVGGVGAYGYRRLRGKRTLS